MAKNDKIFCTSCGSELAKTNFYKSNSELYRYKNNLPICRDCLDDLYNKYYKEYDSEIKALFKLCLKLDSIFDRKLFDTSKEKHELKNTSLPIYYFSKMGLNQYKGKTFLDGDIIDIWTKGKVIVETKEVEEDKFKVTKEMIQRWGKDKESEDYIYLEDRFNNMCDSYDTSNISNIWQYQEIALNYLQIQKLRILDDEKSIATAIKLMDSTSKMMNDCKMKATQIDDSEDDNICFGNFIREIEMNEPIPEPLPFFKDVDGFKKYITDWFIKPFARTLDLDNDNYKVKDDSEEGDVVADEDKA